MRYASFSFILILLLTVITFCTGCSNQTAALKALNNNDIQPMGHNNSQAIDINQEKCNLEAQRQQLLNEIKN